MTPEEIAELGQSVAEEGLAAHALALGDLARAGWKTVPAAASVLLDRTAPDVARLRAVAVVSAAAVRASRERPQARVRGVVVVPLRCDRVPDILDRAGVGQAR